LTGCASLASDIVYSGRGARGSAGFELGAGAAFAAAAGWGWGPACRCFCNRFSSCRPVVKERSKRVLRLAMRSSRSKRDSKGKF